jgi:hypothetical protein
MEPELVVGADHQPASLSTHQLEYAGTRWQPIDIVEQF